MGRFIALLLCPFLMRGLSDPGAKLQYGTIAETCGRALNIGRYPLRLFVGYIHRISEALKDFARG